MPRAFWFLVAVVVLISLAWVGLSFQTETEVRITATDERPTPPPAHPHRTGPPEAPPTTSIDDQNPVFSILDAPTLKPVAGAEVWIAETTSAPPRFFEADGSGQIPRPSSFPALVVVRAAGHRFFAAELDGGALRRGIALRRSFDLEVRLRTHEGLPVAGAEVVYIPPPPSSPAARASMTDEESQLIHSILGQRRPGEMLVNELNELEQSARHLEDLVNRLDRTKDNSGVFDEIRELTRSGSTMAPITGNPEVLQDATIVFPRAKRSDATGTILFSSLLPFGKLPPAHLGLKRHHVLRARDAKGDLRVERNLMRQGPAVELVELSHPPKEKTLHVDLAVTTTAQIRGLCGFDGHGGRGIVELRQIGEGKTVNGEPYRRVQTVQFHAPSRLEAFRFENVLPGSYIIEAWWESGPHEISIARREATVAGDEVVDLGRLLPEYESVWTFALRLQNADGQDLELESTPDDVQLWIDTEFDPLRPQQPFYSAHLQVPLGTLKLLGLPPQTHTVKATLLRTPPEGLTLMPSHIEASHDYDPTKTVDIVFRGVKQAMVHLRVRLPLPMKEPATYCWLVGPSMDLQRSITLAPLSKDDPSLLGGEIACPAWGKAGFFARFRDGATGSFLAVTRDLHSLPDPITLQAQTGAALTGRLLDANGTPYRDVLLDFALEWGSQPIPSGSLFTEVDHEGRFHIQGLPPGATVRFGWRKPVTVRTPSTGTRTVDVVWPDTQFPPLPNPRASSGR